MAVHVSTYTKNLLKSFEYSAIDVIKDNTPYLNSLFKESKETAQSIYQSIKDFTSGKGSEIKEMGKDAIGNLWKNIKEDFKTGKWYNTDREDIFNDEMMKMMGINMDDFNFDFDDSDFDFGSDSDDITDGDELITRQSAKNTAATIMAVDRVGAKVANSINQGNMASANYIVNSNRTMNKAMYALNSRGFATVTEAIATLNKNTVNMTEAIAKPLTTFMQNGTIFFGKATELLTKIAENSEKLVNHYGINDKKSGSSSSSRPMTFDDIMSGDGISISAYKELVKGNIKDYTDFISGFGIGGKAKSAVNLTKGISPMKYLTKFMMDIVIPGALTASLKTFDESLKGFLPAMLAREMARGKSNSFLGDILRGIFLPKVEKPGSIGTKYNQGPIPFDGQTKKAITDVIPKYLANILSAITGNEPHYYDYGNGRFISSSRIEKDKREREMNYARRAGGNLYDDAIDVIKSGSHSSGKDQERLIKELDDFFYTSFMGGSVDLASINIDDIRKTEAGKKLSPKTLQILRNLINETKKVKRGGKEKEIKAGKYNNSVGEAFTVTSAYNRMVRELEASGVSPEVALADYSSELRGKMGKAVGGADKYGNTVLDYLRGIYANTLHGEYRVTGGAGVGVSSGIELPGFKIVENHNNDNTLSSGDIPINANDDEVEKYNKALDKEIEKVAKQIYDLRKKYKKDKSSDTFDQIDALSSKADKLANKYRGVSGEARKNSIFAKEGISSIFSTFDSESKKDKIKEALRSRLPKGIADFFDKPIDAISGFLDRLSSGMTDVLWGEDGIFTTIKKSIQDKIKNSETINKFLDTVFGEKDPETGKRKFGKETKAALGEYWNWMKSGLGFGTDNTAMASTANEGGAANGRRVTKTGMIAVSEGEMIIPAEMNPFYHGRVNKKDQYRRESNAARKFYGLYADGTPGINLKQGFVDAGEILKNFLGEKSANLKGDINKYFSPEAKAALRNDMNNGGRGRMGAGAIIGGIGGGLLGMPLIGAMVGSAAGFISKSETAQKFLFGDVDEEGNRTGGLFGKGASNFLTKVAPEMARGGTVGAVAGALLGPLGMVGGLIAGTAIGYSKKSTAIQEFLFGKGNPGDTNYKKGLFNKEKLQKALPKGIIGAGAGLLLGPLGGAGGLFMNMVLGAGLGFLTTNDKVHKFLFGDEENKKKGLLPKISDTLFGGIKDLFFNTGNYLKTSIENIGKNIITKSQNIVDFFRRRRERRKALDNTNKTGLRKAGEFGLKLLKGLGLGAGGALFGLPMLAPFIPALAAGGAIIGGPRLLANAVMNRSARKGFNIYDRKLGRNMTANERNAYRQSKGIGGVGPRGLRWDAFDETIARMKPDELIKMKDTLDSFDENSRGAKHNRREALNELYSAAADYPHEISSSEYNKLEKLITSGANEKEINDYFNSLSFRSPEARESYISAVLNGAKSVRGHKSEQSKTRKELSSKFGFSFGRKGMKDITKAQDLIDNEIKNMSAEDKSALYSEDTNKTLKDFFSKITFADGIRVYTAEEQEERKVKYETTDEGDVIRKIWDDDKKTYVPDIRDAETKEELEDEEKEEEAAKETPGFLKRIAGGLAEFGKGIGEKAKSTGSSLLEKLKNFGKSLLSGNIIKKIITGIGIIAGLKSLPKLLPTLKKIGNWLVEHGKTFITETIPNLISGIINVGSLIASGIGKVLSTVGKIAKHFFPDDISIDQDEETFGSDAEIVQDRVNSTIKTAAVVGGAGFIGTKVATIAASAAVKGAAATAAASGTTLTAGGTIAAGAAAAAPAAIVTAGVIGSVLGASANAKYHYQGTMLDKNYKTITLTFSDGSKRTCPCVALNSKKYTKKCGAFIYKWKDGSSDSNDPYIPGRDPIGKCDRGPYSLNYFSVKREKKARDTDFRTILTFYSKSTASFGFNNGTNFIPYYSFYSEDLEFILEWQHNMNVHNMLNKAANGWGLQNEDQMHKRVEEVKYEMFKSTLNGETLNMADYKTRSDEYFKENFSKQYGNIGTEETTSDMTLDEAKGGSSGLKGKGSGFVSQLSSGLAKQYYGGSTVAEAGCAPAVASMTANMYGKNLSMQSAMAAGERFADASGTDMSYFPSILGKQGIGTNYTNPSSMMNELAQQKPVILLGQDAANRSKANSPFGPVSHYVLATGFDKSGNVIINDPEADGPRAYNPSILSSTQMAMSTGLKGSGTKTIESQTFDQTKGMYRVKYVDGTYEWSKTKVDNYNKSIVDYYFDQSKGMYRVKHSDGNYEWSINNPLTNLKGHAIINSQYIPQESRYLLTYDNGTAIYSKDPDPTKEKNYNEGIVSTYNTAYKQKVEEAQQAAETSNEEEDEKTNPGILERILSIFSTGLSSLFAGGDARADLKALVSGWQPLGNIFGTTSSNGGFTNKAAVTVSDIVPPTSAQNKITNMINYLKTIQNTEKYSNDYRYSNGYSDCSSLMQRAYKNYLGVNIGDYTASQWPALRDGKIPNMKLVSYNPGNYAAEQHKLMPGDLVYFYNKNYRGGTADNVSHVEMYLGNGQIIGQEGRGNPSGYGPHIKNLSSMRSTGYWNGDPSKRAKDKNGNNIKIDSYDRYLGAARYSGSGSGLTSNAYSALINNARRAGSNASSVSRTNNIILAGKASKTDGMLEQLVAAILDLLTKMIDIDSKDAANIAAIKANSDNLGAITELLGKYNALKQSQAKAAEASKEFEPSAGMKSAIAQLQAQIAK